MDKWGRKPLMFLGAAGMGISLLAMGLMAQNIADPTTVSGWMLLFIIIYVVCFGLSVGPVTWVILSEIYPTAIRGRALGLATFFLWMADYAVTQTFPMMDAKDSWFVQRFNHAFPFYIYAVFCLVLIAGGLVAGPRNQGPLPGGNRAKLEPRAKPNPQFAVDLNRPPCLVLPPTFANDTKRTPMPDLKKLYDSVVSGDAKTTQAITQQALADGVDPLKLVNEYMVPAMDEVGRRFEANEYFVPELLISARAMKAALELIRPLLTARGDQPVGRVAIGTVKGDLHDIGKNLVASLLEGGGFEVIDLGVNVTPEKFIATVNEKQANIVAMSALLTTTMPAMKTTIDALKQAGVREQGQSPDRRRAHHPEIRRRNRRGRLQRKRRRRRGPGEEGRRDRRNPTESGRP